MIILFLVSVILITPITLIENLTPIVNAIEDIFSPQSVVNSLLTQYFPTLILFLFNFVIIPLLIDLIALFEDHKTKSAR